MSKSPSLWDERAPDSISKKSIWMCCLPSFPSGRVAEARTMTSGSRVGVRSGSSAERKAEPQAEKRGWETKQTCG